MVTRLRYEIAFLLLSLSHTLWSPELIFEFFRYPFHDVNPITQLSEIVGGKYITPPGMSFDAKCLISKMLNRDPNERLSAKAILSHAWFDSPEDLKNIALKLEKFEERIQVVPTA